jgi:hypothetical protein
MTIGMPDLDCYCNDATLAGPFENRILYAMCGDKPGHTCVYVTAGKVTAIGRIYAASPERGAGSGQLPDITLAQAIGERLQTSCLDEKLNKIAFCDRFSAYLRDQVVETHKYLVAEIAAVIKGWSSHAAKNVDWKPRNQASFASKYHHFHRPNAFPIMDSFAKAGLVCTGLKAAHVESYGGFCTGMVLHVKNLVPNWTPRSVDTALVARGRMHAARPQRCCCGTKPRSRKGKGTAGNA